MRTLPVILALGLLLALPALAAPAIEPGQGLGKVRLGDTLAQVEQALGRAESVESSPNDPEAKFYGYPRFGVTVFVGSSGKVIGLTIAGAQYRTAEGLGVGSSRSQVEKLYGRGLDRGQGNVNYAARGIAFSYTAEKATHVYLFKSEEARPLLGDRKIVPGKRVGDIPLGLGAKVVFDAWGEPTRSGPLGKTGKGLWEYDTQGIHVVIGPNKTVEGLLVRTGDFITAQGVKVGSSSAEVSRAFGQDYKQSGQRRWYSKLGIGFWVEGDRVIEIQVLPAGP